MLVMVVFFIAFGWIHLSTPLIRLFLLVLILLLMPTLNFLTVWFFFFSSRRRHTRFDCDWSSDVCSSDLETVVATRLGRRAVGRILAATFGHGADSAVAERNGDHRHRDDAERGRRAGSDGLEIGRASCRERGESGVGAGALEEELGRT